jgi:PKD repeat protein
VAQDLPFVPSDGSSDSPLVGDPVKFLVGPDGSLYYVDLGFTLQGQQNAGGVRRIRYAAENLPPVAQVSSTPSAGLAPLTVSFSSAGSFDPEGTALSYAWSFGDGGVSNAADPVHTYTADGSYLARLTLSDGVNQTLSADLPIAVGNPPLPAILEPADGATFRAGDSIVYSGGATDPDEGALGSAALSWTVVFRHEDHIHPTSGPSPGTGGTLVIPTSGHDFQGDTRYEIILTATDATGISVSTSVTVFPEKANLDFDTNPSGLQVEVDGIPLTTPAAVDSLIGFVHTIGAPDQNAAGGFYLFSSWSDGGSQVHAITTPDTGGSWRATFAHSTPPGCGLGPELGLLLAGWFWLRQRRR